MANPDRPRGFTPVKHLNGASWNNALAVRAMIDATAFAVPAATWKIGVGTPVVVTGGAAAASSGPLANLLSVVPMITGDVTGGEVGTYGVVVGIGHPQNGDTLNQEIGPYDPDNLGGPNFVSDADVTADPDGFVLYVAPARDWIFECQTDTVLTLQAGDLLDINMADDEAEQINVQTGRSIVEATTASNNNLRVYEVVERPDNDPALTNADLLVMFRDPFGNLANSQ